MGSSKIDVALLGKLNTDVVPKLRLFLKNRVPCSTDLGQELLAAQAGPLADRPALDAAVAAVIRAPHDIGALDALAAELERCNLVGDAVSTYLYRLTVQDSAEIASRVTVLTGTMEQRDANASSEKKPFVFDQFDSFGTAFRSALNDR